MNTLNKILHKCLVELGCNFEKFTTDKYERVKCQKYAYILERITYLPINGSFTLYINGTYNEKLQTIFYNEIIPNLSELSKNTIKKKLESNFKDKLKKIKDVFTDNILHSVTLLEIFTTYDYLKINFPSCSEEERIMELKRVFRKYFEQYNEVKILNKIKEIEKLLEV